MLFKFKSSRILADHIFVTNLRCRGGDAGFPATSTSSVSSDTTSSCQREVKNCSTQCHPLKDWLPYLKALNFLAFLTHFVSVKKKSTVSARFPF